MKTFNGWVIVTIVAVTLFCGTPVRAMKITEYAALSQLDQQAYFDLILDGTIRLLKEQNKRDDAARLKKLFISENGAPSDGLKTFLLNVNVALKLQQDRDADPKLQGNHKPIHFEHAMKVLMKNAGIAIPDGMMTLGDNFKPGQVKPDGVAATQPAIGPATTRAAMK